MVCFPAVIGIARWFFVGILVFVALAFMRQLLADLAPRMGRILFLASLGMMGLCGGPVYLGAELTTAMNIGLI